MSAPDAVGRVAATLANSRDARWFRAPGRVNLIGEHTDYSDGFVLPVAIDRDCVVAALPAEAVRITSLDVAESVEIALDGPTDLEAIPSAWGRLAAAVVHELSALGRPPVGVDAILASDVPMGSGLSSSAAFEVACAVALAGVAGWAPGREQLAVACRDAEERATGVPCGVMDQLIVLAGRRGCAQLIDCRTLATEEVVLPPQMGLLVVHSGQPRTLVASAYAERRRACEALARELAVTALRDATPAQVAHDPLGRHVVSENARVLEAVRALRIPDLEALGLLMSASHASLRDDFRVSTPELDALVRALLDSGALGARLTGGGFGGAVVAVCEASAVEAVATAAVRRYRAETGCDPQAFACHAVDGAGPLELRQLHGGQAADKPG